MPDLEAVRERILSGLKVGKQAAEYKRTKATLDRFIAELRSPWRAELQVAQQRRVKNGGAGYLNFLIVNHLCCNYFGAR